jgi:hypothetical protein
MQNSWGDACGNRAGQHVLFSLRHYMFVYEALLDADMAAKWQGCKDQ